MLKIIRNNTHGSIQKSGCVKWRRGRLFCLGTGRSWSGPVGCGVVNSTQETDYRPILTSSYEQNTERLYWMKAENNGLC